MKVALILAVCIAGAYSRVSEGDIQYFLWNSRTSKERIFPNNLGNNIISDAPVKFLVHGWTEDINSFWYAEARNNYVQRGANVIGVDWSRHSQLIYTTSVARLNAIGSFIARFVTTLSTTRGIATSRFHFIGHSLGAHLSGFTGKNLLQQSGQRLGRITGLDPAGPSFVLAGSSGRLWRTDADRVDTILTDTGLSGLGIDASLGHVNFWPNGGTASQPGCFLVPCSHNRAPLFFNEGIISNNFVSRRCSSWTNFRLGLCRLNPQNRLGENVDFSITGDFFLSTNSNSPFAQG